MEQNHNNITRSQTDSANKAKEFQFPTWKSVINSFIERYFPNSPFGSTAKLLQKSLGELEFIKAALLNNEPWKVIEKYSNPNPPYLQEEAYQKFLEQFKKTCIASNQFFTVYDMKIGRHSEIDPSIQTALGINTDQFSLRILAGLDPSTTLFHIEDLNHMIRWAGVNHALISFPGFQWSTLKDYYMVSHRVSTAMSASESLKEKQHVTLEKRCYPLFSPEDKEQTKPNYHFDQWTVLDASTFDYVKPRWITSADQSEKMNGLFYLFNAFVLDISPKYISILNERNTFDRNKAIANSLNQKIGKFANAQASFDEIQIGNAFSKSIRQKVALTMNTWDKRSEANLVQVDSDQAAVHYAKVLGLLPVPKAVEEIIFQSVL